MAKNKPWSRDELILALDLYFKISPNQYDDATPEVIALSHRLSAIPAQEGEARNHNYRSPAGIAMKLANLLHLDPSRTGGLEAVSKLDREIWAEFACDRPRLEATAAAISQALDSGPLNEQPPISDDEEASEGRTLTRLHKSKERNRGLVKKKKAKVLKESGKLACEACSFDFAEVYGAPGEGFIECHHTQPLHTLDAKGKTKLSDLALLCANCHRMVHAKRPWLTIEQLQKIVTLNLKATSFY